MFTARHDWWGYLVVIAVVALPPMWADYRLRQIDPTHQPLASLLIVIMLIVGGFSVWRLRRLARRAVRRRMGDLLTEFVAFDADGVTFGTRGCRSVTLHWDLCRINWRHGSMHVSAAGAEAFIAVARIDPQHLEQIRFWLTRHLTRVDVCRQCQYDLKGSPGPACPECGKPIRILEPVEPA